MYIYMYILKLIVTENSFVHLSYLYVRTHIGHVGVDNDTSESLRLDELQSSLSPLSNEYQYKGIYM
jgi:hypothetical protein